MSYVAVSPGDAPPKGLAGFGEAPVLTIVTPMVPREVAMARAKALARVKIEAQARGKKDAISNAEFTPKVLTQLGIAAQKEGVPDSEITAAIEASYRVGWVSVKPLPEAPPAPAPPAPGAPPATSSKTPMIVAGVVVLAAAAFWFMRRKKAS